VKFLENILFAFGCLSLPALVWWQPEIAGLFQRKAGIPDSLSFPVRWTLPFLTLAASGWLYCLTRVVHAGRASQGRALGIRLSLRTDDGSPFHTSHAVSYPDSPPNPSPIHALNHPAVDFTAQPLSLKGKQERKQRKQKKESNKHEYI
jgi:hypothetical protein